MNTQFIYISNIPSNFKPVLLLHELKNKWARMLYLENSFSGLRDAFVYNPTDNYEHFCAGVQNLRNKVFEGTQSLTVYFVWFPPANVFIATMIPAGASMLSYLFVENLHKDVIPTDVIYDLPLQVSDIKSWDIPERPDKCMIVKMSPTCNAALRSFILGTLRSRPVRGLQIRASELIISEENQLGSQLVPRSVKMNDPKQESYLSNFFYLHDIPSNLTVKMLVEAAKSENIRGARIFFVETNNNMKYGFMYVPRSLPHGRFMALHEKMKNTEFQLTETDFGRVKIDIVWFQPMGADVPSVDNQDNEMVMTEYLYLSGVPTGMQSTHLSLGCPWPVKMYLFPINEMSTQIGFVVLRGLIEQDVHSLILYLRNLDFSGIRIQVDEVYLHCRGLSKDIRSRSFQLQPRKNTLKTMLSIENAVKRRYTDDTVPVNGSTPRDTMLTSVYIDDGSLMKTDFICVDNLPKNVAKAALIFDIGRASDGCIVLPSTDSSTAFIFFPDCDTETWTGIIRRLSSKSYGARGACTVYEVYLKTDFSDNANQNEDNLKDSNTLFVYNISRDVNNDEMYDLGRSMIEYCELLETTSGSKSAFILLHAGCTQNSKLAFLINIRKKFLRGKPVYADLVKLAPVGAPTTPVPTYPPKVPVATYPPVLCYGGKKQRYM